MAPDRTDDAAFTAWWCVSLQRHREEADEFGWRRTLDAVTADIEAGSPIQDVFDKYRLPLPVRTDADRGTLVDLGSLGIDRVKAEGDYGCPRERSCGRRAQADPDSGAEPRCAIADRTMRYQPKRSER